MKRRSKEKFDLNLRFRKETINTKNILKKIKFSKTLTHSLYSHINRKKKIVKNKKKKQKIYKKSHKFN